MIMVTRPKSQACYTFKFNLSTTVAACCNGCFLQYAPICDILRIMRYSEDKKYMNIVGDLLEKPEVQRLANYTQHHYGNRLEHVIAVSYLSYNYAKWLHLDVVSVARAGILHDLYYYEGEGDNASMAEHATMHPQIALKNAQAITDVSDLETNIILSHMYPVGNGPKPASKEAWLLDSVDDYLASKEGMLGSINAMSAWLFPRELGAMRLLNRNDFD